MEKVVLKNNEAYRETIDKIKRLIMQKAIYEKRAQNVDNKTYLGNCAFWFQKDPESETHYLIFDKDTAMWDMAAISEDMENLEYSILKKSIY